MTPSASTNTTVPSEAETPVAMRDPAVESPPLVTGAAVEGIEGARVVARQDQPIREDGRGGDRSRRRARPDEHRLVYRAGAWVDARPCHVRAVLERRR